MTESQAATVSHYSRSGDVLNGRLGRLLHDEQHCNVATKHGTRTDPEKPWGT